MISTIGGIMYVTRNDSRVARRNGKRSRARAYPPRMPTVSDTTTVQLATMKLFTIAVRKRAAAPERPPKISRYRPNVTCSGIQCSGRDSRSVWPAIDVMNSHTNGVRITAIAPSAARWMKIMYRRLVFTSPTSSHSGAAGAGTARRA